jgi:2-polyprenyl-6-methoxyphenol hydroxylase-like FAD-dependent oxidoreductase
METITPILIVGAGPVGLTLACLLALRGVNVLVLETRTERSPHSRAIGIHPPALTVFDALGVGDALRTEGIAIMGGQVFCDAKPIGRLDLPDSPLALPQSQTEALLEMRLAQLAPESLRRGVQVVEIEQEENFIRAVCQNGDVFKANLLVGCDGTRSTVRTLAGISQVGRVYPDRYLMGDFADNTAFGTDAALFFSREGIVESFPLPNGKRRWVARLRDSNATSLDDLAGIILGRTGHTLPTETCSWISPFGIEGFIAERFLQGRIALLGDAAHVVSPIGGQGMNLGILGAFALANAWEGTPESVARALAKHHYLAQIVQKRAHFNTQMGHPLSVLDPRRTLIKAILGVPLLSQRFARAFTMNDISS